MEGSACHHYAKMSNLALVGNTEPLDNVERDKYNHIYILRNLLFWQGRQVLSIK